LNNIGKAYAGRGDFQLAIENQREAIDIARRKDAKLEIAVSLLGLAETYEKQGEIGLALKSYLEAQSIAQEIKFRDGLKDAYEGLAFAYAELSDFKNAFKYQSLYSNIKDTLYNTATDDKIKGLQFTYEIEKKEAEIEILNKDNDLKEAQIQKAHILRNFLFATAGLLIIIIVGVIVQYRITKKSKERERELAQERKLNEQLQHIDQLKDQFLANTSHELRTPLNGIIGLAESLKDGVAGELPVKALHDLDMITASGRRLSNLVNDILDFSKLKTHDLELNLKPLDIHAATGIVLKLSKPLIEDKPLELINAVPKDIELVEADENRVQQILHNLVGNAIKFTEKGKVEVSAKLIGNYVATTVSDTGMGISSDKFESIFGSFEQGDGSTAREYGGTGLGLSVTKQLIELHGGEISVQSEVGKGSKFTVTLPLSKITRKEYPEFTIEHEAGPIIKKIEYDTNLSERSLAASNKADQLANGDQIRVLVVDDEPVNRQVLENHLSIVGYEVTQAASGPEALNILRSGEQFDLMLLDIMMPRMSGYEVCHELRASFLPSELPVVMLTAKNRVNDLVEGFNVGANDYLTKPFVKDELLSRIKTHLNLHRINRITGKFVPVAFLKSLGRETITDVRLGDNHEMEVTVFFSDIRSYTTLAETMTPDDNFRFVNAYIKRMGPIIQQYGGFVNQYLGDGIMAIFPNEPEKSLQAAIDMQKEVHAYNQKRISDGREPIKVGMGLHIGSLIMGIIGDQHRLDAATISDTVNTAARIEGLTKHFGASILISDDTLNKIGNTDLFHLRYLGKVQMSGKEQPVGIFECFDGDDEKIRDLKLKTTALFKEAMELYYSKSFTKACRVFERIVARNPDDKTALKLLSKTKDLIESGIPNNWTGIEMMMSK